MWYPHGHVPRVVWHPACPPLCSDGYKWVFMSTSNVIFLKHTPRGLLLGRRTWHVFHVSMFHVPLSRHLVLKTGSHCSMSYTWPHRSTFHVSRSTFLMSQRSEYHAVATEKIYEIHCILGYMWSSARNKCDLNVLYCTLYIQRMKCVHFCNSFFLVLIRH